jgi:preprotein translocase subunit SecD
MWRSDEMIRQGLAIILSACTAPLSSSEASAQAALQLVSEGETLNIAKVADAVVSTNAPEGRPIVTIGLSVQDAAAFSAFTGQHVNKTMTVFACGEEVMHSVIQAPVESGTAVLTGMSADKASALAAQLRTGICH